MAKQIFVNLPVKDLQRSIDFFTKLGFSFNPQFTDKNGTCMIVNEHSYVMLLVEPFFKTFINKEICDTTKSTEAILSITAESRKSVDELALKAIESGATKYGEPQNQGWIYQKNFQDLDGHLWEVFYMELNKLPKPEKKQDLELVELQ